MPERQFGPYRLVQTIASGGMAEVYLAQTEGFGGFAKYVALKMIHPHLSEDEHFVEMLVDEAKLCVRLQHQNIAQVFDLGRVGAAYYLTMEYVDGPDLYKVQRAAASIDAPIPFDVSAYVVRELCAALDYAHAMRDAAGRPLGLVHRDVSPQNVLLSHAGEVKLTDFGIAKATRHAGETAIGVIKGKYFYMSPEQAAGGVLDHRSDLFAAGILLHELLAGQMMYLEEDPERLLELVRRAEITPPSRLRADVPPDLEAIVMRALARRPGDRFQSAADFAAALDGFLRTHAPDAGPARVAEFLPTVLGASARQAAARAAAPRAPGAEAARATQGMQREALVHDRAEFNDENSLIFSMNRRPGGRRSGHEETLPPASPFSGPFDEEPTRLDPALEAALRDDEEDARTVVNQAPPRTIPPPSPGITAPALRPMTPRPASPPPVPSAMDLLPPFIPSAAAEDRSSVTAPVDVPGPPAELQWRAALDRAADLFVKTLRHPVIARVSRHVRENHAGWLEPGKRLLSRHRTLSLVLAGFLLFSAVAVTVAVTPGSSGKSATASLEIVSIPPGARVRVDGRDVGVAPVVVPDLVRGQTYRVRIDDRRHQPWERIETVLPGASGSRPGQIVAALQPIYGILFVETSPPDAEVFLGGRSLGRTPLRKERMDPFGEDTVEVRLRGHHPQRQRLTWSDDGQGEREATLRFTLERTRD